MIRTSGRQWPHSTLAATAALAGAGGEPVAEGTLDLVVDGKETRFEPAGEAFANLLCNALKARR